MNTQTESDPFEHLTLTEMYNAFNGLKITKPIVGILISTENLKRLDALSHPVENSAATFNSIPVIEIHNMNSDHLLAFKNRKQMLEFIGRCSIMGYEKALESINDLINSESVVFRTRAEYESNRNP